MNRKLDWKNESDYEFTKDLDAHGWAWEFLRRNPKYQKRWDELLSIFHAKKNEYYLKYKDRWHAGFGNPNNKRNPKIIRCGEYIDIDQNESRKKWHIQDYFNPLEDKLTIPFKCEIPIFIYGEDFKLGEISCASVQNLPYRKNENKKSRSDIVPPGKMAVIIDPTLPLKNQFYFIESELQPLKKLSSIKEVKHRKRLDSYVQYLRLLDAKAAGAKNLQILKIMFPQRYQKLLENQKESDIDSAHYNNEFNDKMEPAKKMCENYYQTFFFSSKLDFS